MVGSPGKRAMLADLWDWGQCGVRGFAVFCQIFVGCSGLFAGKPAPTGSIAFADCVYDTDTVGAWLAREDGSSVDEDPDFGLYLSGEL